MALAAALVAACSDTQRPALTAPESVSATLQAQPIIVLNDSTRARFGETKFIVRIKGANFPFQTPGIGPYHCQADTPPLTRERAS